VAQRRLYSPISRFNDQFDQWCTNYRIVAMMHQQYRHFMSISIKQKMAEQPVRHSRSSPLILYLSEPICTK
jgi:hypothetical protein